VTNGRGQNVSVITVLHAVSHFSEARSAAGYARNQWLMNWMGPYEG